jgi:small subunit ribosomal protein S19e
MVPKGHENPFKIYSLDTEMAKVIFTKDPEKFNIALAEALKKLDGFEKPEWVEYVKSGVSKERPPADDDFWFTRAASILRQLYLHGVVGVGKLRTRYGSKKNRGGRRKKFFKGSGKIIRVILQQAETAGLVERVNRLQHGRRLTVKGREFLDAIEVEEKKGVEIREDVVKPEIVEDKAEAEVKEDVVEEIKTEVASDIPSEKGTDVPSLSGSKSEEVVEDGK